MYLNNGLTGVSRMPPPYHWANKEQNIVFLRSQSSAATPFQKVKRNWASGVKDNSSNLQILYNNGQYHIVQSMGDSWRWSGFTDPTGKKKRNRPREATGMKEDGGR